MVAAISLDKRLVDPEGFLGPSWLRLPLLVGAAFALDLVPRTVWVAKFKPVDMPAVFMSRVRTHWNRERWTLVVMGLVCFYLTYVSYRNLKSYLPFVMGETKYDRTLHLVDRMLMFGHEPALVLHSALGTGISAHVLSYVYLWFLPLVPLALTGWLIWSKNITYGYWFATSQCIAWSLGTLSYYALPTLGPGLQYGYIYTDLPHTPTSDLMDSLVGIRQRVVWSGVESAVQSVAGFASLHCAITLLVALMVQYTVRNRVLRMVFWVNFVADRHRHLVLRLALHRRRRRRHHDRPGRLLRRGHRLRPEVRETRPGLPPHGRLRRRTRPRRLSVFSPPVAGIVP